MGEVNGVERLPKDCGREEDTEEVDMEESTALMGARGVGMLGLVRTETKAVGGEELLAVEIGDEDKGADVDTVPREVGDIDSGTKVVDEFAWEVSVRSEVVLRDKDETGTENGCRRVF